MKRLLIPAIALALSVGPLLAPQAQAAGTTYTVVAARADTDNPKKKKTKGANNQNQQGNRQQGWKGKGNKTNNQNWQQKGNNNTQQTWKKQGGQNLKLRNQVNRQQLQINRQGRQINRLERRQRWDWRGYTPGRRPRDWDRYQRNLDRRFWERNFRAERRFHWRVYVRPRGWYARRWVYGDVLPNFFWTRNYWIDSYYDFGLDDPPYGFVWVRVGDDALLVNVYDGHVLRVVYGVFY